MIKYIGFCGKAGSGKTTACNILTDIHLSRGYSQIFPWAAELKRICREEFGWNGEKDEKGRKLLQTLGTECGRMYGGELFWVNKWQNKVNQFIDNAQKTYECEKDSPFDSDDFNGDILVLNDDTRFDNEAGRIKENGGTLIRIVGRALDLGNNSGHSSEIGISDEYVDFEIDNSGTIEELREKVRFLVE